MIKVLIPFFFCIINLSGWSQQIKFESFETDSGLSNNSVVDIKNDVNGGLWIATWDGLNYYDGYEFTVYKHEINKKTSVGGNNILKLESDAKGSIWILTQDAKVSKYIGNHKFQSFTFNELPRNITCSKKGNIIVQTDTINYEFINGHFKETEYLPVAQEDNNVFKNILLSKYPNVIINDILKDKSGNIWYATRRDGVYIIPNHSENINNNRIDHYVRDLYAPYSFKSNEIETLHEDVFGNVWLGHKDGGLSMAYSGSEQITAVIPHPIHYPHLPNETIRAITKDAKSLIWLGYYTKGLFYFDTKKQCYLKYKIKEAATNPDWDRIRALHTASDGSIWIGTYAGIIQIKNNNYTLHSAENIANLPNNRNYSIYEDHKKQIWIACWGGLAKFNLKKNSFEAFINQQSLSNYHIRDVKVLDNEIIIATEKSGIILFNLITGKHKSVTKKEGLLGNSIFSIYKDESSPNYWIASLGGISIYNRKKGVIKNITEKDGLQSHMVYGLIRNNDKVWFSSTKGIGAISIEDFSVYATNPKEGWQAAEFSEGAYYQDPKGILFFGGVSGLNYFKPHAVKFKIETPYLKVLIDGNENYLDTIAKKYSNNNLSINIKPIRFPSTQQAKVYYKLEGLNKHWKLVKPSQAVIYENIPIGDYNLLIKNGEENNQPINILNLTIKAPFYKTIAFYALVALFLFLILAYIVYAYNKNVRIKNKKLEEQIVLRTQEILHQKENLLQVNNTLDKKNKEIVNQKEKLLQLHNNLKNENFEIEKFKTFVLSEFREPVAEIIKTVSKIEGTSDIKNEVLHQSGKLINLISEWDYLDHIKDIGEYKTSAVNLLPIIKDLVEKEKNTLETARVSFNCEIAPEIPWVDIDILRYKLLIQYLFHDIVKYSDAESYLNTSINYKDNTLYIEITSNSSVLVNSWETIEHYSPYFKAVQVLTKDLKATLVKTKEALFKINLSIPAPKIDSEINHINTVSWKHLDLDKKLLANKKNILVYSKESNFSIIKQLLYKAPYNLIFENTVNDISSALQHIDIDVLILYQEEFTSKLVVMLNKYRAHMGKQKIATIYISEKINYTLQEQSVELGIDVVIQLPVSNSYINKKIELLIQQKEKNNDALQQEVFKILTDGKEVLTPNEKLIKKSLTIIKEELHDASFNVEKLIEHLEISRIKCYRLFKEVLKESPSDIIIRLRLEKAIYLLKTKHLNISEISFECGYNDPKYFGRLFKKHFSVSPKAYKEKHFGKRLLPSD